MADSVDIKSIFGRALEFATPAERSAYLAEACQGDPRLRAEVESLLQAQQQAAGFFQGFGPLPGATAAEPPVAEQPGTVIGPYTLREQIGEGGFGLVFVAEQTQPVRRKVALKVIKPGMDTRQVIARFEAERQALAIMDHPNIARVLDGGATESGRPYFVMELVKGVPITQFCDEQRLTPRQRLELFVDVCSAVQHAHHKGIIHRDLKPSNVLVTSHDGKPVVKVIDFGVAKAIGQQLTDKTVYTQLAQLVGTPLYMSPEQAGQSGLDVDTRSDIYSLGVLLYELLTGTTPFSKERFKLAAYDEIRRIIREEDPPKPSTRLSHLSSPHAPREEPGHVTRSVTATLASVAAQRQTEPAKLTRLIRGELDWIVMKALEKDRNRRYETANGFAMDVQRYLADEPVQACPPSVGYRLRKFVRRNKGAMAAAAAALLFLATIASGIGWTIRDRAARQTRLAGQIEVILAEAERLMGDQKWPEALAAVQRAEPLIAGGEAHEVTQQHVEQVLADLKLVERLEEARLQESQVTDAGFDRAGAEQAYARVFAAAGLTIEGIPVEQAAGQCRSRTAIRIELASALTDWARLQRKSKQETDDSSWRPLLAIADAVDPDPWRRQLRARWNDKGKETIRELADIADVDSLPASNVVFLGRLLRDHVSRDEAAKLLLRAQQHHPDDFWINFELAGCLALSTPKRLDEAAAFYRAADALRPRNAAVHNNLGVVLKDQGKFDDASACYRRAIELAPKTTLFHRNLGSVLMTQGKLDDAVACFRRVIESDPKSASAHGDLGTALRGQGKLHRAIEFCRRAIDLDPNNAIAHIQLGTALTEQPKLDEAIACFRKAIELDPTRAAAYAGLGTALRDNKETDEAIACFRKAIELAPDDAATQNDVGNALRGLGQMEEAIACFRKAIELKPIAAPHYNLGLALAELGKLDDAIVSFNNAIKLEPDHAKYHDNLGLALYRQKKFDEAVASCRNAIALNPQNALCHNNLGAALLRQNKFEEAIPCFKKAIEIDPKNAKFHDNLGDALREKKQLDDAIACYRKAIDLNPDYASAHNSLGNALRNKKQFDEAIASYRKAIELSPKQAVYHSNLGGALGNQKKDEEAAACFRRAIELDPTYARAYSDLVIALNLQGKTGETIAVRRKLIELQPNDANARNGLAWLLATSKDIKLRRPAEAVALAAQAVKLSPEKWAYWNTFSIACYRAGAWQEALEAREQAIRLNDKDGALCWNGLSMAMIRWQLGQKEEARTAYDRVADEAKKYSFLQGYLLETQQLLGIMPAAPKAEKR